MLSYPEIEGNTMEKGLESLEAMEYPGRIIIIGKDKPGRNVVVTYAITGRSPSSQARKLVIENGTVWTRPTDETTLQKGNLDLLVYPAIWIEKGIAVSNGKQTEDIRKNLSQSQSLKEILLSSLEHWDYEPDAPNFTPRISGCILSSEKAVLSIIKRDSDGSAVKSIFEFPLLSGQGKMITTYNGENIEPLPSFRGEPLEVGIQGLKAERVAEAVYQALNPKKPGKDFRVAVACMFSRDLAQNEFEAYIINRYERVKR
jgi:IMP cyclohydrolase